MKDCNGLTFAEFMFNYIFYFPSNKRLAVTPIQYWSTYITLLCRATWPVYPEHSTSRNTP